MTIENDMELLVRVSDDFVTLSTDQGAEVSGRLNINGLHQDILSVFQSWVNQPGKITARRELEVFGRLLFDMLFDVSTAPFLASMIRKAKQDQRLRINLAFSGKSLEYYSLPWEYLYFYTDSGDSFFLSTRSELVLSRYVPLATDRGSLVPKETTLRLLVVTSRPKGFAEVLAGPVITEIQKLADAVPAVTVERLESPTISNYLNKLMDFQPHALHFMGHGTFDQASGQGQVNLLDEDGVTPRPVSDKEFADFFTQVGCVPRLVVMHMCEGGVVEAESHFSGVALKLVMAGIPAVVAMQHAITNNAAIYFSRAFYRELMKGSPVDRAVQMGRWWITLEDKTAYNSRVFGTPVLYLRSRDGVIIPQSG